MIENIAVAIEDILFVMLLLLCLYGVVSCYKHTKTIAGADLVVAGLLLYGIAPLFALGATGFGASYFENFSRVGLLNSDSYMFILGVVPRLGLILVFVGLFRMAKTAKDKG